MNEFKKKLKEIDQKVTAYLEADCFTKNVKPSYLADEVKAYPLQGGKRLRPALALWCCAVFSGKPWAALPVATAIEVFHNWTLVHDDIIDQDDERRGVPTSHINLKTIGEGFGADSAKSRHFGISMSLLTGDLQQAWCFSLLHKQLKEGTSAEVLLNIQEKIINELYPGLLSGEAIDVELELRKPEDVFEDEILDMLSKKTGLLLKFSAETGALIGLGLKHYNDERIKACGEFAMNAGLAFQLQDDLLGVFADHADWGKPVGADIRTGKKTYLIQKALHFTTGEEHQKILNGLGDKNLSQEDLKLLQNIIENCGARKETEDLCEEYIQKSKKYLAILPENIYKELLDQFADFLIKRNF